MKRCALLIPDAGPLISLWVADRLDLLLRLDMPIIVVDAVYDEATGDPDYPQDADIKAFIESNKPPFVIEETQIGCLARERKQGGKQPIRNAGELAIIDFISEEGRAQRYLCQGGPLLVLFEDRKLRVFQRPPNMHLLSTVGLLRGMERIGLLSSADTVIQAMTQPTQPGRRARAFADLPLGTDEKADIGSS